MLLVAAIGFYIIGYGFARGQHSPTNHFIGNDDFSLDFTTRNAPQHDWHLWLWEWVFCAASATIMAGAVAERGTFISYCLWMGFYSM